ncbi:hypothetical protein J6590_087600 [Homalodisca vitripennis]|nr:hypothetical protein J6590_087600 [Homalodisca vitripennis]
MRASTTQCMQGQRQYWCIDVINDYHNNCLSPITMSGPLVKERTGHGGYMTVSGGGLQVDCWLASLDRWL